MSNAREAKIAVKALIAQNIDQAIRRLEEILDPASPAYNTFVLLKSRYSHYHTNVMLGITGHDEMSKLHTQISHAFIMAVDALVDSDLKPSALQPAPTPLTKPEPQKEIPPQRPEVEKAWHPEEHPPAEAKAAKPVKSVRVRATDAPKADSLPPVAVSAPMANRKYLVIGVVVFAIVSVTIWTMFSNKEKPAASLMAENQAGAVGVKQPDNTSMTSSIQPQVNAAPQKAAEEPAKQPAEPTTETKKASTTASTTAASLSANDVSFDGKTYRIFRSRAQVWMAQNFDYQIPGSWCYSGSDANCLKYGRLYTLSAAKKACAAMGGGWRVPTAKDWKSMAQAFGGAGEDARDGGAAAFKALTASGPKAFSAQLGGWRNADGNFKHLGSAGYYWSSSENELGLIEIYHFSNGELSQVNNDPTLGFSCRCVK